MKKDTNGQHKRETRQAAFLAAYRECGTVRHAAEAAKVARSQHYEWMADRDYASAFEDAQQEAADALEREAVRRASEGLRRYKFDKGVPIKHPETGEPYFEHEYSDSLLIFLLKGAKPEKYRERVEHSGEVRALVVRDVADL